jgi:hypothetical protein
VHVGDPVLDGLEAADRPTELGAPHDVLDSHLQCPGRDTETLRALQHHPARASCPTAPAGSNADSGITTPSSTTSW